MTLFDGSDFHSIDEDGLGDGTAGSTQPLDTALEHQILNNERFLRANRRRGVTWSPNSARVLCHHKWTTIWMAMWPLEPTLERLSLDLLVEFDGGESERATIDTAFRCFDGAGGSLISSSETLDQRLRADNGQPTEQYVSTELTFDDGDIDSRRWVALMLDVKNTGRGETWDFVTDTGSGASPAEMDVYRTGIAELYLDEDIPNDAMMKVSMELEDDRSTTLFELGTQLNHQEGNTSSGEPYYEWVCPEAYRAHDQIEPGEQGWIAEVSTGPEVYYKAINLREEHRTDLSIDSQALAGDVPYETQRGGYRHGRNVDDSYQTVRPVDLGWPGSIPTDADIHGEWRVTDFGPQPMLWGYHFFNQGGEHPENCHGSIKPGMQSVSGADDRFDFRFFTLAFHMVNTFQRGADADYKLKDLLEEDAGSLRCDFDVSLYDPRDESLIGQSSTTLDLRLYPTDSTGRWQVLQQLWAMNHTDEDTNISSVNSGNRLYGFKEGCLARRDYALIQPQQVTVDLEAAIPSNIPIYWSFDVTSLGNVEYGYNPDEISIADRENLGVAFMHPAVFERPQ